eukprot:1001714-Pelagomonas_calceolata.AAC.1
MALLLCWGLSHIVLGHECCATEDLCQMTLGEHGVKLMKGTAARQQQQQCVVKVSVLGKGKDQLKSSTGIPCPFMKKKENHLGKELDLDLHGGTFSQTVRLIGL